MTVFNVECFYLGVKYITARYCDFTNVILSVFKFVIVGIDVSVLIGNILCKRSAKAVGDKKCYAADAFACYRLGKIYLQGEIMSQNLDKAEKYLLLAEDSEYTQYALAKLYLQEEKYDIQKAVNYFENCADKNHWASYQLGRIYLFGAKDIERDKEKAVEWFTKSANDGNECAQAMLDNISKFENVLLANTIFSLLISLSRCIQDSYGNDRKDLQSIVDRKLMRVIRKKKMELGEKEENHMDIQ